MVAARAAVCNRRALVAVGAVAAVIEPFTRRN
jgi:hypothetical protein